MLRLPEEQRHLFKSPFGRLYRDIEQAIPDLRHSVIYAVGDIVTYRLLQHGIHPDIAVIDGHTMRVPCNRIPSVYRRRITVPNPPGTLTEPLITALREGVSNSPVLIFVDGEEDLAVIPLVIAAPPGARIIYGQPGEGVVVKIVDDQAKRKANELLSLFIEE